MQELSRKEERARYLNTIDAEYGGETCEFCGSWRPCECDEELFDDIAGCDEEDCDAAD